MVLSLSLYRLSVGVLGVKKSHKALVRHYLVRIQCILFNLVNYACIKIFNWEKPALDEIRGELCFRGEIVVLPMVKVNLEICIVLL